METLKVHKVIVRPETYDIISADTGFYAFLGKRLYHAFDRLVCDEDKAVFYEHAEKMDSEFFVIHMIDEEGNVSLWCARVNQYEKSERLEIEVANIADMFKSNIKFSQELNVKNRLLDLYGDFLFVYEVKWDRIIVYETTLTNQWRKIYKFSEIVDALKKNAGDNEQESVDKFIAAAKKGEREFELRLQGAIFETGSHIKFTNIRATSIYEGGELISIVGYVHQGMKGDFSPKHRLERDSFTGLLTKGEIVNAATRAIDVEKREGVTLAIIDIDHFKKVNDTFGHMVGDEIIKNVATLIEREVGDHGLVGRFGGDEFFILFYDVYDMEYCRELLRGIKSSVPTMYPVNDQNKPAVTISVGCAAYPKDADNYEDIFTLADFALYRAKEKGRNRYIIYDKAKHGTLEEIKNFKKTGKRINSRGLGSIGEVLCMLMDRVCIAKDYTAQKVLDDLVENSSYERIIVYSGTPYKAVMTAGDKVPDDKVFAETESYLMDKAYIKEYKDDILIVNNIELLESKSHSVCEKLGKQGVLSFIQIRFKDKNGVDSILSLEAVNKGIVWDEYNLHYYRLMAFLLSQFDLS